MRWELSRVRRIFAARLVCMFAVALLCLVGTAGGAFAQTTSIVLIGQKGVRSGKCPQAEHRSHGSLG